MLVPALVEKRLEPVLDDPIEGDLRVNDLAHRINS